jgi:uncharacterized protein YcbX
VVKVVERSLSGGIGIGTVAALWRYPVKSMLGHELEEAIVTEQGLAGDRAYAVANAESGQIRNAKRAGWENLFEFRAALKDTPGDGASSLRITLPDGEIVTGGAEDRDERLSAGFGRDVRLVCGSAFFDLGAVHLLTTASLKKLGEFYPAGRFDPRRFRPNIVLELNSGEVGFVEEGWMGRTLAIGDEVQLRVTQPVARCVMTTLSQADLPKDPSILNITYRHNDNQVGVYADVLRCGTVHCADPVVLA